jgi:rSAM/selenodomain-associated transferase 2/rSAM/selenodomain-associated transferase 1
MIRAHRLIVFGRYPSPGQTKTRLIPSLGPANAAEFQRFLTEKTLKTARSAGAGDDFDWSFCYTGGSLAQIRRWLGPQRMHYTPQDDGDLGRRMESAMNRAFAALCSKVVLIGTDIWDLAPHHLQAAFKALDSHDLVLGPSTDGGYWLIGARRPVAVFRNIPWGSDAVLAKTLNVAAEQGLRAFCLPPLSDVDSPQDLHALKLEKEWCRPYLSVILPVLNEASRLKAALESVQTPDTEAIVVDGGSADASLAWAKHAGARVIRTAKGRALQQNCGARTARGRVLLFLHADTQMPPHFCSHIFETLMDPKTVLGAFRFKTDWALPAMRLIEMAANLRSRVFKLPYGDQGLFLRSGTFWHWGGFAPVPVAEDLLLARRAAARGRVRIVPAYALTSARRWRRVGLLRTTLINYGIAAGCLLGVSAFRLAPLYYRWSKPE